MSNTVAFIFKAIDRFSPVIKKVSNVTQKANNQLKGLARVANRVDEAFLKIQLAAGAAASKLKKAGGAAEFAKKKFGEFGRKTKEAGKSLTIGATLPILLLGRHMIKAASDSRETAQKFGVIFKGIEKDANSMAKNLADNFNLANDESKELLANTADLLIGFDFPQKKALELSNKVQILASDLANFNNLEGGTTRASQALTKALIGEREALVALNIKITEKQVKSKIGQLKAKGAIFSSEEQAKAEAVLALAFDQSKNAIDNTADSQEQLATLQRELSARTNDLSGEYGELLIPLQIELVKALTKVVNLFRSFSPLTKKIIIGVVAFVAILGPLLLIFGGIIVALPLIIIGLKAMGVAMAAAFWPVTLVIALVAGAVAAAIWLKDNWIEVSNVIGGTIEQIGINFNNFVDNLVKKINAIKTTIKVLADQATFGLFDFAGDENIPGQQGTNFGGTVESINRSQTDINVNMNAPKGVVKNIKSKSTGSTSANVGVNMVTAP
jgi:phage-related minor tail protein